VEDVRVGDVVRVRPGSTVPVDGVVVEGFSTIDESMLTGESVPLERQTGDEVAGGTLNVDGSLLVQATRVGSDTALARIVRLVEEAQSSKAPVERLSDRVSSVFVPVIVLIALGTAIGWFAVSGHVRDALLPAVAVLIIACPCALGLATPTAVMVGTGRGALLGIVIRGGDVLERSRGIDIVVFDKTGTLTQGRMTLREVVGGDDVLAAAASVEAVSEHPIARAVVEGARASGAPVTDVSDFRSVPGRGVMGLVGGRQVLVGRRRLFAEAGYEVPGGLADELARLETTGRTAFLVGWDGSARGAVAVADAIKDGSREAVRRLHRLGIEVAMITGDNHATAVAIAREAGIERVLSEVLPEHKVEEIRRLQESGKVVAMVGDGINDAPALAQADLGIAMGTGTDVAIEASDITIMRGDPRAVPVAVSLARRTFRTIVQNLWWAFGYNVLAVPLAAAGLLNPIVAGAAMAFSSVSVVTNSLRLRRFTD
jgi:heavy metal translocating P-type ATPase